MISRLAIISAWLLAGTAAWFAIFWGLLHVPESSVWMLALSAVLALALVVVAGAVLAGASAAWDLARPPAHGLRAGVRTVPAALAAALLFGAIWWLTGLVFEWHTGIAGQIDAWVIARTGRPNARWIHFTIFWVTLWVRWSIGLALASSLLGALTTAGAAALRDGAWLRSALGARAVADDHLLVRPAGGDSVAPRGLASGQAESWRGTVVRRREARRDRGGHGRGLGPGAPRWPRSHREYLATEAQRTRRLFSWET